MKGRSDHRKANAGQLSQFGERYAGHIPEMIRRRAKMQKLHALLRVYFRMRCTIYLPPPNALRGFVREGNRIARQLRAGSGTVDRKYIGFTEGGEVSPKAVRGRRAFVEDHERRCSATSRGRRLLE